MADRTCGRCGQALRSATKFCGGCGASVEPEAPRAAEPSVPPMAMREFEAHVVATLQEGTALGGVLEDLLAEAAALGIDRETALGVIETADAMAGASEPIAVRVWYDAERAGTGVVDGNTLLAVRVENRSGRALQRVRVLVVHPQTQEVVGLPEITTLNKGQAKETDADLVFTSAGRQAVRVGWVEVQWLTGTRVVYRLTDVLQLRVESAGAARTTIHSISQTIQTHGGGVVSAGGLSGVQQPGGGAVAWQEVRLRLSNIDEVTQAEQLAATRAAAAASEGEPTPVPAVVPVPPPPSGLMAVPRSPTSVQLSWVDNAVDERGFYVERASDGLHFTRLATVSADTVTYLVHGLTPHQAYTFRVQAFNDAGPSDYSNLAAVLMPPEMAAATPDVAQAARETAAVESLRDAARALADAAARHTPVSTVDEPALPSHVPLPAANTLRWVALLASGLVIAAVWAFLKTPDSALSDQQPEYPTETPTQEAASQTGTTPTEALPPRVPDQGHLLSDQAPKPQPEEQRIPDSSRLMSDSAPEPQPEVQPSQVDSQPPSWEVPPSGTGSTIQFDAKGVEFGPWVRRFVAQVRRNWRIPDPQVYNTWSFRGRVVVQFNIHKDGHITDVMVASPPNMNAFNRAASNAILSSNPTAPLPPEYPDPVVFFTVTFYYNEQPPV